VSQVPAQLAAAAGHLKFLETIAALGHQATFFEPDNAGKTAVHRAVGTWFYRLNGWRCRLNG
jgi:hypothetical protein